jgi:hypothetical protein
MLPDEAKAVRGAEWFFALYIALTAIVLGLAFLVPGQ